MKYGKEIKVGDKVSTRKNFFDNTRCVTITPNMVGVVSGVNTPDNIESGYCSGCTVVYENGSIITVGTGKINKIEN